VDLVTERRAGESGVPDESLPVIRNERVLALSFPTRSGVGD
jgi:hypothetical protein